jgi:hypothetical protein
MRNRNVFMVMPVLLLAACGDTSLLGSSHPPDETAVIDAPPLTLPPDYELRPPRDGSRSEDVLRQYQPEAATPEDAWLVKEAGRIDPNIRQQLEQPARPVEEEAQPVEETEEEDSSWWKFW